MKVCYIDETGSEEDSPFYVMVGICFDWTKHTRCSQEANFKVANIKKRYYECTKIHTKEIKTKTFLAGGSKWSMVPSEERDAFITDMFNLFKTSFTNSFDLYVSILDNDKYKNLQDPIKKDIDSKWVTNALHIVLQRESDIYGTKQNKNNKALTFMIFDEHPEIVKLNNILYRPMKYLYEYYTIKLKKKNKKIRLESVIGEGFCINSEHSGLCQLADICCYVIRRYLELASGREENYIGEKAKFTNWYRMIQSKIYKCQKLYAQHSESSIVSFYHNLLPNNLNSVLKK